MNDPEPVPAAPDVPGAIPQDLLVRILISAESLDSIVVGGQALNMWGEHFFPKVQDELRAYAPFQSKDIDFFGDVKAAAELARMLEADLMIPSRDDVVTPNSAAIDVKLRGKHYTIDFLHSVAGLDAEIMRKRAQILEEPLAIEGGLRRDTEVRLLHPVDVLISRIAGVTLLKRRDPGALRQLAAAPIVLREFIRELLDIGDQAAIKEAQEAVREFIRIGNAHLNDPILDIHGVDILAHAAQLADHPAWHPSFAKHQIRRACAHRMEKRDQRIAEAKRRAARQGS